MNKKGKLKMFLWESELKRDYTLGQLIVLAKNIEEAKNKIRDYFRKRRDEFKMSEDEFDILEKDISSVPIIYDESEIIEISGSA